MATNYPINPRVRAFGKARIDNAERAKNQAQWEKLWEHPANSFPFVWGESWKQCVEYRVADFPAEVGFFIDILGLPINALDLGYAMFTSPQGDFFFSIVPTPQTEQPTPPDAFRLQFMVKDIYTTTQELQQRGIDFEQTPQPLHPGSSLSIASFRTPHGICVELWGKIETGVLSDVNMSLSKNQDNRDEIVEDGDEFEEDVEKDNADEDEFDKDEENSKLIPDRNGNDEEGEIEGDEKFSKGSDDDEFGEDPDDDEDDDKFEFDEDEDDFDEDEDDEEDDYDGDFTAHKSDPRKSVPPNSPRLPMEAKLKSLDKMTSDLNKQGPEYIDIDVT